jgi:hypothetical protein
LGDKRSLSFIIIYMTSDTLGYMDDWVYFCIGTQRQDLIADTRRCDGNYHSANSQTKL